MPLCRVPEGRHHYIKRALDAGAHGVIVPMVESVEHARECIAACKYPPQGARSVGGTLHALNFDASTGDYYKHANDEILVVLQIESPRGAECAQEMCQLPGLDAIFIGPNDLQAQMRTSDGRNPSAEAFEAMLQRILAAGKSAGCAMGLHVSTVEDARQRVAEGWQFIGLGSELRMMVAAAQQSAAELGLAARKRDLARYSMRHHARHRARVRRQRNGLAVFNPNASPAGR